MTNEEKGRIMSGMTQMNENDKNFLLGYMAAKITEHVKDSDEQPKKDKKDVKADIA